MPTTIASVMNKNGCGCGWVLDPPPLAHMHANLRHVAAQLGLDNDMPMPETDAGAALLALFMPDVDGRICAVLADAPHGPRANVDALVVLARVVLGMRLRVMGRIVADAGAAAELVREIRTAYLSATRHSATAQ